MPNLVRQLVYVGINSLHTNFHDPMTNCSRKIQIGQQTFILFIIIIIIII